MILFKASALARQFAEGKVDSRARFRYLLLFLIYLCISNVVTPSRMPERLFVFNEFFSIAPILAGVAWCYRINRAVDDKDFVDRLVAFTVVNALWILLALVGLGFGVLSAIVLIFNPASPILNMILGALAQWPGYFVWFLLVGRNIQAIARQRSCRFSGLR